MTHKQVKILIVGTSILFLFVMIIAGVQFVPANSPLGQRIHALTTTQGSNLSLDANVATRTLPEFQHLALQESALVGKVDPNPESTKHRLTELATTLTPEEKEWLKNSAIADGPNGDLRAFAVYLLALNGADQASSQKLAEIMNSPLPMVANPILASFEETIRGLAMDGLLRFKDQDFVKSALSVCVENSASAFLADRAKRGLLFLEGSAPAPADQEHKSLTELLKPQDPTQ